MDRGLRSLPKQFRDEPGIRQRLISYTADVVRSVAYDFAKGAERGIEQAAKLLNDPDYYLTLKERRRRAQERHDAYQAQQDQERLERRLAPTAAQIEDEMAQVERYISDYERDLERWRDRLKTLKAMVPKHVRITEFKTASGNPDE